MSEHSYDPAFDDTRASGRRAPPRSVSRVVEPVVETHVETGSGSDEPGRTRLGVTLSREQREWVDKESRRRGVPKAAVVRDLISHAYAGGVPPSGAARGAVTVDDFGDPVDPLRPPPTVVADPVVSARESAPRFRRQAPTVEHRVEPSRLHGSSAWRRRCSRYGAGSTRREWPCPCAGARPAAVGGVRSSAGSGRRAGASDGWRDSFRWDSVGSLRRRGCRRECVRRGDRFGRECPGTLRKFRRRLVVDFGARSWPGECPGTLRKFRRRLVVDFGARSWPVVLGLIGLIEGCRRGAGVAVSGLGLSSIVVGWGCRGLPKAAVVRELVRESAKRGVVTGASIHMIRRRRWRRCRRGCPVRRVAVSGARPRGRSRDGGGARRVDARSPCG